VTAGGPSSDEVQVAPEIDRLDSHDDEPRPWWSGPTGVLAIVVVALLVAAGAVNLVRELREDRSWPTDCGIDGHDDWCATPSEEMTDARLAAVARAHCPALAGLPAADVVPQPLGLIGPPNSKARACTTGSPSDGTEDALLGQSARLSWVTRQVGGSDDGQVQVSCPDDSRTTAGLELEADQLGSTVAAINGVDRRIDFGAVAEDIVGAAAGDGQPGVSLGFLSCDTSGVQLTHLRAGSTFSCAVELYSSIGRGSYHATYQVTDHAPYFTQVE